MTAKAIQPIEAVRALDHYIVQVRDLDSAGDAYERLGFNVLPRMKHIDVGTSNRVVQFATTYLEILGDFDKAPSQFSEYYLPRFECGEGLVHVSLRSFDLNGDHEAAKALGFSPHPILNARRKVVMPDDTVDETDSRCFYMWRPDRLYLSLFLSQHHKPDAIWISQYQQHANSAEDTAGVTFVSNDPQQDREYFSTIYRTAPKVDLSDEVVFSGSRGDFAEILSHEKVRERYKALGVSVCENLPGYPIGLTIRVRSLAKCRATLQRSGIQFELDGHSILVAPEDTHGVIIEFRESV